MKAPTKNMLRQTVRQARSLLGLVIIIAVGIGFYVTIKTSSVNYENSSNEFFHQYALPDLLISGGDFDAEDERRVAELPGVQAVQRRAVVDTKRGDHTLRLLSYDTSSPRANKPYIYHGDAPRSVDECLITEKYAEANQLRVGDRIEFSHKRFKDSCTVTGFATTPEDLYLKQSATQPIADPKDFGMLYVDTKFMTRHELPLSEVAVRYHEGVDTHHLDDQIAETLGEKVRDVTKRPDIYSYNAFKSDVEHFGLMAYVFPLVFLIIAAIVIFVGQRRNVLRDRRQIGILKAMGCGSWEVMRLYVYSAVAVALVGSVLGFLFAQVAGPWVIGNFDSVLSAPFLDFDGSIDNLVVPSAIAVFVCVVSTLFAVGRIVMIRPAEAMHAEPPQQGKDILLQRLWLWRRMSFNSRYAAKATLRNKGRFVAMVCGMIALLMLTVMSLGFRDSFRYVTSNYYDTVARYDLSVNMPPTPYEQQPKFTENVPLDAYERALVTSATLEAGDRVEDLPLLIADDPIRMHNLTTEAGDPVELGSGVVLPKYYAEKLGVNIGDEIEISTPSRLVSGTATVSDLSNQNLGFTVALTFDTARNTLNLDEPVYNTVYAQSDTNVDATIKKLEQEDDVLSVSSITDDKTSYQKLTDTFGVYTTLLVVFSIVLGIATLYSISSITLLARQYEFIVLQVMGYSRGDILKAYLKELASQFFLALPIGLIGGYVLTIYLTSLFSNDSMLFQAQVTEISYAVAIVAALVVIAIVWGNARSQVNKQDLVAGLKAREE
ncbi:ABC transporter permease [Corynebacterium sp.]|uniref:ABC transporter permease n=1 Tax=Corynebacterium sp. TaxID=1720 RepID=UPI0026DC9F84|nr:ABC transporter permease [Corynebacterium sp.]MDO5077409.1 FtsX-like permease family protein [Corynebacterium sp.]